MTPIGNREGLAERLAGYVRAARRRAGLTQTELAELAGVGRRFVSEMENGKRTLRIEQVERVLGVLGRQLTITKLGAADGD